MKLLVILLLFAGCASLTKKVNTGNLARDKGVAYISGIPYIEQKENFCGPASMAMVLRFMGEELSQDEIAGLILEKSKSGTFKEDLILASRVHQYIPIAIDDRSKLQTALEMNKPVIVFQNLGLSWYPLYHYSVVVGYQRDSGAIYIKSGMSEAEKYSWKLFDKTWNKTDRWGIILVAVGEEIKIGSEIEYLKTAAVFEKVGKRQQAHKIHEMVINRWPESFMARVGLGNILYSEGKYAQALEQFKIAHKLEPENNDIQNNIEVAKKALRTAAP